MKIQFPALLRKPSSFMFLCLLFLLCVSTHPAIGQQAQTQTSQTPTATPDAASMTRFYWLFLSYQHHLDLTADNIEQSGKGDASNLRNALQKQLHFSDADFAPIRASSQRLMAEWKELNEQAKTVRSTSNSSSDLDALAAQKEANVAAEIDSIGQALSTQKKAALDAFVVQFFSHKGAQPQASPNPASAEEGVQQ